MKLSDLKVYAIAGALVALPVASIAETITRDMPACVSKDDLDELTTYAAKGDKSGMTQLYLAGTCTMLKAGQEVSVIDRGFMTSTIRYRGVKLFTPTEAIR